MYPKRPANQTPADYGSAATVFIGKAVRDAAGIDVADGAVALTGGRVLCAGGRRAVLDRAPGARVVERPDAVLLPGLVNAHTHLDLTSVGYWPYGGDFIEWVRMVIDARRTGGYDPAAAVRKGAGLSLAAGVVRVGDIAGDSAATEALAGTDLSGVSFVELMGIEFGDVPSTYLVERVMAFESFEATRLKLGLQPHAPYSTGHRLYEFAGRVNVDDGVPICTHLAETAEELQFVAEGDGPFQQLLESMGKWHARYRGLYSEGLHPVHWLMRSDELAGSPQRLPRWLCAHCNYVNEAHIERLAAFGASVAYCPRASDYFGHANHRYRDMLDAGVNVALGTDSIVCHGTLSVFDEMRHLHRRDQTDAQTLLEMATVNGNEALGLGAHNATFAEGATPGVVAVRAGSLEAALSSNQAPAIELLAHTSGAVV